MIVPYLNNQINTIVPYLNNQNNQIKNEHPHHYKNQLAPYKTDNRCSIFSVCIEKGKRRRDTQAVIDRALIYIDKIKTTVQKDEFYNKILTTNKTKTDLNNEIRTDIDECDVCINKIMTNLKYRDFPDIRNVSLSSLIDDEEIAHQKYLECKQQKELYIALVNKNLLLELLDDVKNHIIKK
jgi:hypothetical protein